MPMAEVYKLYHQNLLHFMVGTGNDLRVYADNGSGRWEVNEDRYLGPISRIFPKNTATRLRASVRPSDISAISLEETLQDKLNAKLDEAKRIAREGHIGRIRNGKVIGPYARFSVLVNSAHTDYDIFRKRFHGMRFPWDKFDEVSACKNVIAALLREMQDIGIPRSKDDKLFVASANTVIEDLKVRLQLLGSPYETASEKPAVL